MSPVQMQLCMFSCGNVFSAYQHADLLLVSGSKCEFQQVKPDPAGACLGKTTINFNESLSYSKVPSEASEWVMKYVSTRVGFCCSKYIDVPLRLPLQSVWSLLEFFMQNQSLEHFYVLLNSHFISLPSGCLIKSFQLFVVPFGR